MSWYEMDNLSGERFHAVTFLNFCADVESAVAEMPNRHRHFIGRRPCGGAVCQWHTFSTDRSGSVEAHSPVNSNRVAAKLCMIAKKCLQNRRRYGMIYSVAKM